jgi:GNAT superfamily N-acetyltransferase
VSEPSIRPYRDQDWAALWPIIRDTVREQETYCVDPAISQDEARAWWCTGRVTVALDGSGRLRGSAHAYPNREGPGAHIASASFMVAPDSRGEGVGRRLVEDVIAWARAQGYSALQFNAVVEGNRAAEKLYEDLGFAIVGTVPGAFRSPTRGDVGLHVMHLPLA